MFFWNRREVLTTLSMDEQTDVCRILREAGIKYIVKVVGQDTANWLGPNRRGRFGSLGMNQQTIRQYSIYVHKKDEEEAIARVSKRIK